MRRRRKEPEGDLYSRAMESVEKTRELKRRAGFDPGPPPSGTAPIDAAGWELGWHRVHRLVRVYPNGEYEFK